MCAWLVLVLTLCGHVPITAVAGSAVTAWNWSLQAVCFRVLQVMCWLLLLLLPLPQLCHMLLLRHLRLQTCP